MSDKSYFVAIWEINVYVDQSQPEESATESALRLTDRLTACTRSIQCDGQRKEDVPLRLLQEQLCASVLLFGLAIHTGFSNDRASQCVHVPCSCNDGTVLLLLP